MPQLLSSDRSVTTTPLNGGQWCKPSWVHVVARPQTRASTDDEGHGLRCRWYWPTYRDEVHRANGVHARHAPQGAESFTFDTDPGLLWLPGGGRLELHGGRGLWTVEVWSAVDDGGPAVPQEVWLTRYLHGGSLTLPPRHVRYRLLAGQMTVSGIPASVGTVFPASTAAPGAVYVAGWFQTGLLL